MPRRPLAAVSGIPKAPIYAHVWLSGLVALLVLSTAMLAASPLFASEKPTPIKLSGAQLRQVASGQVIVDVATGDINRGYVIGVVEGPLEKIWPIVVDCGKYGDWRDNIYDTATVRRVSSSVVVCKGSTRVPFPARNRHGHFTVTNRKQTLGGAEVHISSYKYIPESGNLNDMYGYWLLQPFGPNGEHTLIKHVLNVDIGGWLPDFLVRWASRNVLPDTILGLRLRYKQLHK